MSTSVSDQENVTGQEHKSILKNNIEPRGIAGR